MGSDDRWAQNLFCSIGWGQITDDRWTQNLFCSIGWGQMTDEPRICFVVLDGVRLQMNPNLFCSIGWGQITDEPRICFVVLDGVRWQMHPESFLELNPNLCTMLFRWTMAGGCSLCRLDNELKIPLSKSGDFSVVSKAWDVSTQISGQTLSLKHSYRFC